MKMGFTKIACRLTEPTYALSASQTLEGVCQRTILMQNSGMNNGQPMPIGTPVKAYLGGVLKGQTTVQQSDGYYRITGENEDFPSGTYNLISDDGYNYGTNNCSHTETQTTNCNIQTVPYSP